MTDAAWGRDHSGRRRFISLTALNLRTSRRYQRCAGRHRPSGETVIREFPQGPKALPICKRCRVPYGSHRRWGDSFSG